MRTLDTALDTALDTGARIVDLFCAAVDRPLYMACRKVDLAVAYRAAAVTYWLDDTVDDLDTWYDRRAPGWAWRMPISVALFNVHKVTDDAWQRSVARWRRVGEHWKTTREPERFGTYLRGVQVA